jgi:hypothetical protein
VSVCEAWREDCDKQKDRKMTEAHNHNANSSNNTTKNNTLPADQRLGVLVWASNTMEVFQKGFLRNPLTHFAINTML